MRSFPSLLLVIGTAVQLLLSPISAADVPSTEECMQEGVFCFEVLKGQRYSYRIRQDSEPVLFSLFARREPRNGDYASYTWNISLSETIDIGHATLVFVSQDQPHPALKFDISRQEDEKTAFKLYEYKENDEEPWSLIGGNRKNEYIRNYERQEHSVKVTTLEKVDQLIGLESKNLTIEFTIKTELVNKEPSRESITIVTTDGHYFFKDKQEIREYREKRRIAKQKEAARTNMTIIIISVVVGLIVVSAIIFAIFKFRK